MRGAEAQEGFSEEARVSSWVSSWGPLCEGWEKGKGGLSVKLLNKDGVPTVTIPREPALFFLVLKK